MGSRRHGPHEWLRNAKVLEEYGANMVNALIPATTILKFRRDLIHLLSHYFCFDL